MRKAAAAERTGSNQQRDMVCLQMDGTHYNAGVSGYYGALVMGGPLDAPNEILTGSTVGSRAYNSYADFVYRDAEPDSAILAHANELMEP